MSCFSDSQRICLLYGKRRLRHTEKKFWGQQGRAAAPTVRPLLNLPLETGCAVPKMSFLKMPHQTTARNHLDKAGPDVVALINDHSIFATPTIERRRHFRHAAAEDACLTQSFGDVIMAWRGRSSQSPHHSELQLPTVWRVEAMQRRERRRANAVRTSAQRI